MRQKKLIDLYKEWMETGTLPGDGLCNSVPKEYKSDLRKLEPECYYTFWAYPLTDQQQLDHSYYDMAYSFTPLRQTIVLFICAMNNEL